MADVFKKSSLEKLSSPEQLDKAITITSPLSWLAVLGVAVIFAATVLWAVFGSLPTMVSSGGVLASPIDAIAMHTDVSGEIVEIHAGLGASIQPGDPVMSVRNTLGEVNVVYSGQSGLVTDILAGPGDTVTQGAEVLRLSPVSAQGQIAICYVPYSSVGEFSAGMKALVYPAGVDSQELGHMEAEIIGVGANPATLSGMEAVLGSENPLIEEFSMQGAVAAVALRLREDAASGNGYYWSSPGGGDVKLRNGAPIEVKIVTGEYAPITRLFPDRS